MTTVLHWYHISISIHALLAESDFDEDDPDNLWSISIHALLAESDKPQVLQTNYYGQFLSTLSLRRATCYSLRYSAQNRHFYPRSPCGERPRGQGAPVGIP